MSIAEQYKSLRTPSSTWAREVAGRVHKFYGEVLEHLEDTHENWFMETDYEEHLGVGLHLFALEELATARAYANHPTMQLHEFVVTQEPSEFSEAFFRWYCQPESRGTWKTIQKNISDIDVFEGEHYIAATLARRNPHWMRLSDDEFSAAWHDAEEEARKEYREHVMPRWT